jgi:uncharacterized protein (TIGR00251 family)
MVQSGLYYRWEQHDLVLDVRVQPRAKRDEIEGTYGKRLRIRISAPPIDGRANAHLIKYLAKVFKVRASKVEIVAGKTSRDKRIKIHMPQNLPDMISKT